MPTFIYRNYRNKLLASLETRSDREYILDRVDYYCKLNSRAKLSEKATSLINFHRKGHRSVYFFDSYEYIRWFPELLKWHYVFGDVRDIPDYPAIVKSRPIDGDNENSVLLNMDKVRHFVFLNDEISFKEKRNQVIFRGEVLSKTGRIQFMERWFGNPMCDLGDVSKHIVNPEWKVGMMTLYDHLKYKFIMALEGNDVASNLKWVMSSNSLAVMPKPTFETWFMEGRLIPNYHYVEVKPDYSDLKERLQYYIDNPVEAELMIEHAHEWVQQFKNKKRERLISLLVLEKYFCSTGQSYILDKKS